MVVGVVIVATSATTVAANVVVGVAAIVAVMLLLLLLRKFKHIFSRSKISFLVNNYFIQQRCIYVYLT